jgi:hypothetical protein
MKSLLNPRIFIIRALQAAYLLTCVVHNLRIMQVYSILYSETSLSCRLYTVQTVIEATSYWSILAKCDVAQPGCVVAQMVVRRLAVRHARVRFPAQHPREVYPKFGNICHSPSYRDPVSLCLLLYFYK